MLQTKVKSVNKVNPKAQEYLKQLVFLNNKKVEYGFFDGDVYTEADVSPVTGNPSAPPGTPVAAVAAWNNDGVNVPQRNFFDKANIDIRATLPQYMKAMLSRLMKGTVTLRTILDNLGENSKEQVVKNIEEFPGSNSNVTVADKGFDDPLRFSGKLINSVKFRIK